MWSPWERAGLDHLFLQADGEGIFADGVVIGAGEGEPFRLRYRIRCDVRWRVRELMLESLKDQGKEVRLLADGRGRWWTAAGGSLSSLEGCIDVDVSTTPFTNTLPIRRLDLDPGESEEIRVAYVDVPGMGVEPAVHLPGTPRWRRSLQIPEPGRDRVHRRPYRGRRRPRAELPGAFPESGVVESFKPTLRRGPDEKRSRLEWRT
jgi:uncharacterized protein